MSWFNQKLYDKAVQAYLGKSDPRPDQRLFLQKFLEGLNYEQAFLAAQAQDVQLVAESKPDATA